jgi:hypothetical protein
MGNDGGALTSKRSMLGAVMKQRRGANDDAGASSTAGREYLERQARCQTCALTQRVLAPPIVGDRCGNLMSREAVVELLLARKTGDSSCPHLSVPRMEHLKKLKDVVTLATEDNSTAGAAGAGERLLVCATSGQSLSRGSVPFGYFFECGHCVSAAAAERLESSPAVGGQRPEGHDGAGADCPVCGKGTTWVWVLRPSGDGDGSPTEPDAPLRKAHRAESLPA